MDVCAAMCHLSHTLGPENGVIQIYVSRLTAHVTHLEFSKIIYLMLVERHVCLPHIIFCKAIILEQKYCWKTLFDRFLYLDIHSELKELDKVIGDREENDENDEKLSFQRWL